MKELLFIIEEAPEGGFIGKAVGEAIFAEADTLRALHDEIRDAIRCHFDADHLPKMIRLHFVKEEILAL